MHLTDWYHNQIGGHTLILPHSDMILIGGESPKGGLIWIWIVINSSSIRHPIRFRFSGGVLVLILISLDSLFILILITFARPLIGLDSTVSRKTCPPIRIETDPINRISLPANQNSAQNFLEFSSTFLLLSLAPHQCPSLANLGPLPRALSTAEQSVPLARQRLQARQTTTDTSAVVHYSKRNAQRTLEISPLSSHPARQ